MEAEIPDELLARFSEFVAQTMGLHFPPQRFTDLRRGLAASATVLGFETSADCAQSMMSTAPTRSQLDALASNLTVGETYFFRDTRSFEILADQILPDLIRSRQNGERRLRLWSAACCTGEEAYSIAILLRRMIPDCENWNVTLLATDINPRFLRIAEAGVFGQWSFRDCPHWLKEQYFHARADGRFEILPQIRRQVRFAQLNLAQDAYPTLANDTNAMDVIFCRNVLMYFTPARAMKVVANLHRAQVDGGWLIVSPGETVNISSAPYSRMNFPGAILYRKEIGTARIIEPQTPAARIAPLAAATALYEQGNYAAAALKLEESPARQTPEPIALRLLARSLANQGNLTQALACCDQWIAADKLNSSAHYFRAIVLQEQGQIDPAIRSLRKAIFLDPQFVLAHFALGNISRSAGHAVEAKRHLANVLQLLRGWRDDQILAESEGITAGRLAEIVGSLLEAEAAA